MYVGVVKARFIIFIEIGICTAREHPNTAEEEAVTVIYMTNHRLPRREEDLACA